MAIKTKALLMLAALSAATVHAKPSAGNWAVYPLVDYTYENVVDAADRTYFLSGGTLFSRCLLYTSDAADEMRTV